MLSDLIVTKAASTGLTVSEINRLSNEDLREILVRLGKLDKDALPLDRNTMARMIPKPRISRDWRREIDLGVQSVVRALTCVTLLRDYYYSLTGDTQMSLILREEDLRRCVLDELRKNVACMDHEDAVAYLDAERRLLENVNG